MTEPSENLKRFLWDFQSMVELAESPRELLLIGGDVFRRALAADDLIPGPFLSCDAAAPRLRALYEDSLSRFCIACLALAPGQAGPVLPVTGWRLAGVVSGRVMRGARVMDSGDMEAARPGGGAALYQNPCPEHSAVLLLAFDARDLAAEDAPVLCADAAPFNIFTIQTRLAD